MENPETGSDEAGLEKQPSAPEQKSTPYKPEKAEKKEAENPAEHTFRKLAYASLKFLSPEQKNLLEKALSDKLINQISKTKSWQEYVKENPNLEVGNKDSAQKFIETVSSSIRETYPLQIADQDTYQYYTAVSRDIAEQQTTPQENEIAIQTLEQEKTEQIFDSGETTNIDKETYDNALMPILGVRLDDLPDEEKEEIINLVAQEFRSRRESYTLTALAYSQSPEQMAQNPTQQLVLRHQGLEYAKQQANSVEFIVRAAILRYKLQKDGKTEEGINQAIEQMAQNMFQQEYTQYQKAHEDYKKYQTDETSLAAVGITYAASSASSDVTLTQETQEFEQLIDPLQMDLKDIEVDQDQLKATIVHPEFNIPIKITSGKIVIMDQNNQQEMGSIEIPPEMSEEQKMEKLEAIINDQYYALAGVHVETNLKKNVDYRVENLDEKYTSPILKKLFPEGKTTLTQEKKALLASIILYLATPQEKFKTVQKRAEHLRALLITKSPSELKKDVLT